MNKSLAFYVDNLTLELFNLIKNISTFLIKDMEDKHIDFLIFTDSNSISDTSIGVFPTFYSRFYSGSVVFFDKDSYAYLDSIKDRFLYIETKDSISNMDLHNLSVIIPDNNSFKVINYEKLQQSF
jgi:hypothetical protein